MDEVVTATGMGTDAGNEDRQLAARARNGDRSAFDRLVLKYRDPIMNLCVRMLGNRTEGEDAAQDAFVRAYNGLRGFKGDSLFSTWLYRIAVNTCRNRRRSWWHRMRRKAVNLDEPQSTEDGEIPREVGDERLSPEKDLERRRIGERVRAALARISAQHRELVVLRDIQSLSYEEIVEVSGISLGTVKSRLARAREALREELRGKLDGV